MAAPAPVIVRRVRREIVAYFEMADATAPERAIAFDPGAAGFRDRAARRRMTRRLRDFGAIREAAPGRFYLDRARLGDFVAHHRLTTVSVVAGLGAAVAAALALGG